LQKNVLFYLEHKNIHNNLNNNNYLEL